MGGRRERLDDERGGDEEKYAGELESQPALLGTDSLQPQRHLASTTKSSSDEHVQCRYDDDWNDRNQAAVDRVHYEVGKLVILTTAADLHTMTLTLSDSCFSITFSLYMLGRVARRPTTA